MQQRIINRVESDTHYRRYMEQNIAIPENTASDAVIVAARSIAQTINAKAIVCFSLRGSTVLRAARKRPSVPILALCPFPETARQLALSWGVYPELSKPGSYGSVTEDDMYNYGQPVVESSTDDFDLVLRNACRSALNKGLVSDPSDLLVVTAGLPFGTPGASNIIRVVPAAGPSCWDGVCRVD
jgi:pyruvate kinase